MFRSLRRATTDVNAGPSRRMLERRAGFALAALTLAVTLCTPDPALAQFDDRVRWSVWGGTSIGLDTDLYDGVVHVRRKDRPSPNAPLDSTYFDYRMQYRERIGLPIESWLRLEVTRNESHFAALRGRWGRGTTESNILGAVGSYPALESGVSWLGADLLLGLSTRGDRTGIRFYFGGSMERAWLHDDRPDTVSARAVFLADSLIYVRLPWHEMTISSRGFVVGAELRVPIGSRFGLTLGLEQRAQRVNFRAIEERHTREFTDRRQRIVAEYDPFVAYPRALTIAGEWTIGTRRQADTRPLAVAAVRERSGGAAVEWRNALPDPIREALEAADTAAAIALLETEVERQPRNPLIIGTLGVLLAEQASNVDSDFQQRVRAERLLEDALALDPGNPRYLVGYATVLQKRSMSTDARRVLGRAFEAAIARPDQLSTYELADAFYRVGLTLEQRVIETEGLRLQPSSVTDPAILMALNYMGPRTREILMAPLPINDPGCEGAFCLNWAMPRAFHDYFQDLADLSATADSLRAEMITAFEQAIELDPLHDRAHRAILAARARAGQWDEMLADARRYYEADPSNPWGTMFLASAHYWEAELAPADSLFRVAMAGLAQPDRAIFQDLSVVLPAADDSAWNGMDERQRSVFRQVYWRMRDPLYITAGNEREVEHLARVSLAELLFGDPAAGVRGWETDRGQILIRYGRPLSTWQIPRQDAMIVDGLTAQDFYREVEGCLRLVESGAEDADIQACFEAVERFIGVGAASGGRWVFWNYHPDMPSFIFEKQLGRAAVRHMTRSQSMAYADDLRGDMPVMYNPPYYDAGALTYQAARFRGSDPERQEVVFYAQAPVAGLAASPEDSVTRGLVLHAGETLVPVARQVEVSPIRDGQMNYRVVVSPGTYTYALEALGSTGLTSTSSRGRLDIEPVRPGLAMSDLLLASYAGPRRDIPEPRTARELDYVPLRCMAVPDERIVAFVFEVYGLEARNGAARYRVTLDTGELEPAGVVARLLDRVRQLVGGGAQGGTLSFEREADVSGGRDRVVDWFEIEVPAELTAETIVFGVTITDLATGQSVRSERRVRSAGCS